jgi:hypothetical protein
MEVYMRKRLIKKSQLIHSDLKVIDLKSARNIVYIVAFNHSGYEGVQSSVLAKLLNVNINELTNKFVEFGGKKDGIDVTFKLDSDAQKALEWCRSIISENSGK